MRQFNFDDTLNPKTAAGPALNPPPPATYDFGRMVQAYPTHCGWGILKIYRADMDHFALSLIASIVLRDFKPTVTIRCITPVDYAVRPPDPALIDGAPCIEYHEDHEQLRSLSRCVPHSDGEETFDPAIKFTLLQMDQTYIIAQRFELTILSDGVSNRTYGNAQKKDRALARLQRDLEALEKFRITPTQRYR